MTFLIEFLIGGVCGITAMIWALHKYGLTGKGFVLGIVTGQVFTVSTIIPLTYFGVLS